MWRLRTTSGLSVLALAVGIAGTGGLSALTGGWHGPPSQHAVGKHAMTHHAGMPHIASATHPAHSSPRRRHAPVDAVHAHAAPAAHAGMVAALPHASPSTPALVPLAMPGDTTQRWDQLRDHLDGRVVVHIDIDGSGRVEAARVVESSGDPVLDEHALRSVRGWRFAVPPDHPEGISGDLPMRFSSQGERVAQLP